MEVVRQAFRPEFLNRLDEILLFRRLSREDMTGIVDIQLRRLQKLLADRKITLELDDAAKRWLADAGYDPVYGARPLKRVIQRELQNPLALEILEGRIRDGDTVRVTASPLGLLIEPPPRERAVEPEAKRPSERREAIDDQRSGDPRAGAPADRDGGPARQPSRLRAAVWPSSRPSWRIARTGCCAPWPSRRTSAGAPSASATRR